MRKVFLFLTCMTNLNNAFANSDLLDTVKVTQALIAQGYNISNPIAVETAEQMSVPPLRCVLIVTERTPNTACPESPIGPNIDKGALGCLNEAGVVIKTSNFLNACP